MNLSAIALLGISLVAAAPKTTVFYPSAVTRGAFPLLITAEGDTGTEPKIWVDDPELQLTPGAKPGQFLAMAKPKCRAGWHAVRLYNKEGATAPIAIWVDDLANFSENEPNNAHTEANAITLNRRGGAARVTGKLEKNSDVDGFQVRVPAGMTLVTRVEANRTLGSPMDASLQITDLKGFVLAHNDDSRGVDPELTWTAREAADIIVRIFAFPADPNSTINFAGGSNYIYQLTLATGPTIDHLDAVAFSTGQKNHSLIGWNLANTEKELEIKPVSPDSNWATATLPDSEPLFVPSTPFNNVIYNSQNKTHELNTPMMAGGTIQNKNEIHKYSLTAKKGEVYQLRVMAKVWESILDPALIIRDEKGQVILELDDSGNNNRDIDTAWTAPTDGKFQVEITDLHRRGGTRLYYGLEVTRDGLPPELLAGATNLTLKAGEKAEIAINYDKRADLESPLKIQLEGLPKGFPPVKPSEPAQATNTDAAKKGGGRRRRGNPAAGQNTITMPMTLTAEQVKAVGAWSGPLKIVATDAEGKKIPVRIGGDKGSKMGLDHVWLTILPPEEPKKEKPAEEKKKG